MLILLIGFRRLIVLVLRIRLHGLISSIRLCGLISRIRLHRLIVLVLLIGLSFASFSLHSIRFHSSILAPIHLSPHLPSHRIPRHSIPSLLLFLPSSKPSHLSPSALIHHSTRTATNAAILRRGRHSIRRTASRSVVRSCGSIRP